jgi:hypothetical protein
MMKIRYCSAKTETCLVVANFMNQDFEDLAPTGHRVLNGRLDNVLDERLIKSFEKVGDRLGASYWGLWKIPSHHILQKIRG